MNISSGSGNELIQIADAVAKEKLIDPKLVIEAMEESLAKAAKSKYGQEYDIRAAIESRSGTVTMSRFRRVVEQVENHFIEINEADAKKINPDVKIDNYIEEQLPPMDFGRIAAQAAKQIIVQKVREADRARQYEEYKDKVGQIINGQVKRVEYGNVIVDLGRAEAILKRDQLIRREVLRVGDRVRAYIKEVKEDTRGPQIFLSRTNSEFLVELFKMEVPEIYDGIIDIKTVCRDPGSRAKIGVLSHDNSIDPVGACVGMRGSRVQAVVNELQGEKIDIIPYDEDPARFVCNALAPSEVSKVIVNERMRVMEVVVPDESLSLAIGRRGQNVRLAAQLTGWKLEIRSESKMKEAMEAEGISFPAPRWTRKINGTKHGDWEPYREITTQVFQKGADVGILIHDHCIIDGDRVTPIVLDNDGVVWISEPSLGGVDSVTFTVCKPFIENAGFVISKGRLNEKLVANCKEIVLLGSGMGAARLVTLDDVEIGDGTNNLQTICIEALGEDWL